jgi:cell division protein FtsL
VNGAIEARRGVSFGVIFFELVPAALLMALFAAVGIVHVTGRVLVVKVGYQLSKLDADREVLTREHDRLQLELATEKAPARLEAYAKSMGMAAPAPSTILHAKPSPLGEGGRAPQRSPGEGQKPTRPSASTEPR